MKVLRTLSFLFLGMALVFSACKKEEPWTNPFDDPALDPPQDTVTTTPPNPDSFRGLHANIFSKTCANSGCHDGAFEPDFRTIESAYNTLLYKAPIKNDTAGTYTYRVEPGDAINSVLYQRLIVDIDGQSGIMPLAVDPDSDWDTKKNEYIDNIRSWINNGAKDVFDNAPSAGNLLPQVAGVVAFANGGGNPLPRKSGEKAIKIPQGTSTVDLWFALTDAETNSQDLTNNKILFSNLINSFDSIPEENLTVMPSPITEDGYFGDPVDFYHKITVNVGNYTPDETIFMRVRIQDNGPDILEMPNQGSATWIKDYVSFIIE